MGNSSSRRLALVVVGSLILLLLPSPYEAAAALPACTLKQQIFVFGNSLLSNTNGSTNRIYLQNRNMDADCEALALSTSHSARGLSSTSDWGDFIEIGWQKIRRDNGSIDKCIFWEKSVNFSATARGGCGGSGLDYGVYDRWRVTNPGGTTQWEVWSDLNDDGTYVHEDTWSSSWGNAWAMGETERKGNDTGMVDDQRSLRYKNNSGTWTDWPNALCDFDDTDAYEWDGITSTHYDVTANTNDVCD